MSKSNPSPKIRWWPLWSIGTLLAIAMVFIWGLTSWTQHSVKLVVSFFSLGGAIGLALVWFFFFSRIAKKIKFVGLACLIGISLFCYAYVDIREVNGDVMPILAWSWTPTADEGLANTTTIAKVNTILGTGSNVDYPRFLGPQSNGIVKNISLDPNWIANPPVEKWRIQVGDASSSFAVKGGLAVTQEQRGENEMITCYALNSGELIWAHADPGRFATTVGGNGPRATPTIAGDKVYTVGAMGLLNCLDLATGTLIWQKNMAEENNGVQPQWGYACSPLVIPTPRQASATETKPNGGSDLVVVSPGGPNGHSLVAYHASDGSLAWHGGNAPAGYSSPQLHTLTGREMILIFNKGSIAAHDPSTGKILWEVPWLDQKPCVANPRVLTDDRVLVSAGYGQGSKMYQISRDGELFSTEILFESRRLKAKFANFVVEGNHVYGLDDGVLTCIDATTGKRAWKKGRYGHGQLMLVGDLLLVQAEGGKLHLLEATPEAHKELASIPVLNDRSWNTFALADNLLLMRNHREAVCLELANIQK